MFLDFWSFNDVLDFEFFLGGFGSLQTSLLCIVGDLAGRGALTVAVGVSER